MRGLFIGLGSVGQRHLRNAKAALGETGEFHAWRATRSRLVIEGGAARKVEDLAEALGVQAFGRLDEALAAKPDFAVISNPTSLHAPALAACLDRGLHCLVEKPLVSQVSQLQEYGLSRESAGNRVMVGYQFRWHPAYRRLVELLLAGRVGNLEKASFHWGTYLPGHHRYEDYRRSYAARADLGGGALNGLSHDLDLLLDLLGAVDVLEAEALSPSRLEMSGVEEAVRARLHSRRGVLVGLYLSYGDPEEAHWIELEGSLGRLRCDFGTGRVTVRDPKEKLVLEEMRSVERNELFFSQMLHFFKCIREGRIPTCDFQQGVDCIRLADEIRACL